MPTLNRARRCARLVTPAASALLVLLSCVPGLGAAKQRTSWILPEAQVDRLLYVAEANTYDIAMYTTGKHPHKVGELDNVGQVGSIWVDAALNLYVQTAYPPQVQEYPPGATSPSVTYFAPCQDSCGARSLAVDSAGIVYVGTYPGGIYEFKQGNSMPFQVVGADEIPFSLAVDGARNLYEAAGTSYLVEYPPGSQTGTKIYLRSLESGTAITIANGLLASVSNFSNHKSRVIVYKLGNIVPLRALFPMSWYGILGLIFDAKGNLYASHGVDVVLFPNAENRGYQVLYPFNDAWGLAVNPPAP